MTHLQPPDSATLRAEAAFAAHAAMMLRQRDDRRLFANPFWTAARFDAFEGFAHAFDALPEANG